MGIVTALFSNMTNPLEALSFCMFGFIGTLLGALAPKLIQGIFGKKKKTESEGEGGSSNWLLDLFGGLAGDIGQSLAAGKGKKQDYKQQFDQWVKMEEKTREWKAEDKPDYEYSRGRDPVTAKAIQNMFASRGMAVPQYSEVGGMADIGKERVDEKLSNERPVRERPVRKRPVGRRGR